MEADLSALSTSTLVAEITTLAGHLNAAQARFLALVAELDRRNGWAEWGVKSMAHWLNWKCGIGLGAAREKVRVARALGKGRVADPARRDDTATAFRELISELAGSTAVATAVSPAGDGLLQIVKLGA